MASRQGPIERRRRGEVADAGHDHAGAARESAGDAGVANSAPSAVSALRTDVRLPAP